MSVRKILLSAFLFCLLSSSLYSQVRLTGINSIIASIDTFRNRMPVENIYIQTDKPYYAAGDTLWFKAYLFDADLSAAERSGLMYIELANDTGKVMDRRMVSLSYGLGSGNIALNKEDIPEGSYTLRAYTNWMRNFGEEYVFKKSFYIGSLSAQSWLVNTQSLAAGDSIRFTLQFRLPDQGTLGLRDLQLRLMEGKKNLFRSQVQTSADGKLDISFALPPKADTRNITLLAQDLRKGEGNRIVPIPVSINRPENTDVQFMPEGGRLVAGLSSRVGFKALGEDGKSAEIQGTVTGSTGKQVAVIRSQYKGMGSFDLSPEPGLSYTASITLPGGLVKSYPLPEVSNSGMVMKVTNEEEKDSVEISIQGTADIPKGNYSLLVQTLAKVCYATEISFTGQAVRISIPKVKFPTGIARFTLLSPGNQPVCERIIFIDHNDQLNIKISTIKPRYSPRDSIALQIQVRDADGKGIEGSFSVAVTDDNQVKADSTGVTILSHLLLSSELKGTIEEPAYYFQNKDTTVSKRLDNLLLTQGWIGYSQNAVHNPIAIGWKDIFNPKPPVFAYTAEPEFVVKGRVHNALNKPVAGTSIQMFSTRPVIVKDMLTDQRGEFSFKSFPPLDTAKFAIQARNKNDKSFNVGIEVEEFKPPVFQPGRERFLPWYLNSDTTLLKQIRTRVAQKEELAKLKGENILEAVTITGKKVIKNSWNLNGPGESDQALELKDMEKAGKMTLEDLLMQKIKGFKRKYGFIKMDPRSPPMATDIYVINEKRVTLVLDGIPVGPTRPLLTFLTAEDITGIEVMYNIQYSFQYDVQTDAEPNKNAYIEVTTRSGNGAFMKKIPGTYFYKAMPFAGSKEFYRPRYMAKDSLVKGIDLRSTIHWAPNVITDASGKAIVSFYAADKQGAYTAIVEGTDMNGKVGYQRQKIRISTAPERKADNALQSLVTLSQKVQADFPREKVHLQLDKPYYSIGDTIWLKAYVVNAENNELSEQSQILYVDLINEHDSIASSLRLPLTMGLAGGDFTLSGTFREGSYRIRAYTTWMRNFGEEFFFDRQITIGNALSMNTVASAKYTFSGSRSTETVTARIHYQDLSGNAFAGKEVNYEIRQAGKPLKGKGVTDQAGDLQVSFPGSSDPSPGIISTLMMPDAKTTVSKELPIQSSSVDIGVQFFPEGGQLVNGISSRVGFKALGSDGLGKEISGYVSDKDNNRVAEFKSAHAGMGSFTLQPLSGNSYTATIRFADGKEKQIGLPKAIEQGYVLSVTQEGGNLSIRVTVSKELVLAGEVSLIGQTNGVIHYLAKNRPGSSTLSATLPQSRFPEGILQLTLFSAANQPVAERLVFIHHPGKHLRVNITAKPAYKPREKVQLNLRVTDQEGTPVEAGFSLAVTDEGKVPYREEEETTIFSNLLLSSGLKGYIEQPNYYFTEVNADKIRQLDNLLLSQGWRRFVWKDVQAGIFPKITYRNDQIGVSGKVSTPKGAPVPGGKVTILLKIGLSRDTVTDAEGRFNFDNPGLSQGMEYNLLVTDAKGSKDVLLDLDKPVSAAITLKQRVPQENIDDHFLTYLENSSKRFREMEKYGMLDGILLQEVSVTAKKMESVKDLVLKGSASMAGAADQVLTFLDLMNCGGDIGNCLSGRVTGVTFTRGSRGEVTATARGQGTMLVVVDGVPRGTNLSETQVQDIAAIEVVKGARAGIYGMEANAGALIITTKRGGDIDYQAYEMEFRRPGSTAARRIKNYTAQGTDAGREFYSPDYANPKTNVQMADLRTTVYWNPNIITDASGKATVEFYNTDGTGNYRVIAEGLTTDGNLGRLIYRYTVQPK